MSRSHLLLHLLWRRATCAEELSVKVLRLRVGHGISVAGCLGIVGKRSHYEGGVRLHEDMVRVHRTGQREGHFVLRRVDDQGRLQLSGWLGGLHAADRDERELIHGDLELADKLTEDPRLVPFVIDEVS